MRMVPRTFPHCEVKNRITFTGLFWFIESDDPKLRAIQKCIAAWQRSGASDLSVPLVLDDIRRIMDGELR